MGGERVRAPILLHSPQVVQDQRGQRSWATSVTQLSHFSQCRWGRGKWAGLGVTLDNGKTMEYEKQKCVLW